MRMPGACSMEPPLPTRPFSNGKMAITVSITTRTKKHVAVRKKLVLSTDCSIFLDREFSTMGERISGPGASRIGAEHCWVRFAYRRRGLNMAIRNGSNRISASTPRRRHR